MTTLNCFTGSGKTKSGNVYASYCVPLLGHAEKTLARVKYTPAEFELVFMYDLCVVMGHTHFNSNIAQGFLKTFDGVVLFTSQKEILTLLKTKKVAGETLHRMLTDLTIFLEKGIDGIPITIQHIPKKKNLAYKLWHEINFQPMEANNGIDG